MQIDREQYLALRSRWLDAQKEMRLLRLGVERAEAGNDMMSSPVAFVRANHMATVKAASMESERLVKLVEEMQTWLGEEAKRFDQECTQAGIEVSSDSLLCPTCGDGEKWPRERKCPDIFHGRPCTACNSKGHVEGVRCEPCYGSGIRFVPREGATS